MIKVKALLNELRLNLRDLRLMFERREIVNKPPWDKKAVTLTYYEALECLAALKDYDSEYGKSARRKLENLWGQEVRTDGITCWEE